MGSKLGNAIETRGERTENAMAAHTSTLNNCVNLFFQIGAMRGMDKDRLISYFTKAYNEDAVTAMKVLFWARDVRGGAGERQIFRDILTYMANNYTDSMRKNLGLIPEFGRWDDLLVLTDTKLEKDAFELIREALNNEDGLCSKWMPRPNVKNSEKKRWAKKLREHLDMTPKEYRKLLASITDVVENKMCAKNWEDINFEHIPSRAQSDYSNAFIKHQPKRFQEYLDNLKSGDAKINAEAVYPYDITKTLKKGNSELAVEQWKQLPNWMEGSDERILPVVDTSGSMNAPASNNPNVQCIDVSVSLGLYISERNEGEFKNEFITFSRQPRLQRLKGNLEDRFKQLNNAEWGGNTDIEKVFSLILNKAVKNDLSNDDLPTMVLIISDMEFDMAAGRPNDTVQDMIKRKYDQAGYKMPKIVHWNVQSRHGHFPVQFDEKGTALISGFSPSIMKSVIAGEDMNPYNIMMKTIDSERYQKVTA